MPHREQGEGFSVSHDEKVSESGLTCRTGQGCKLKNWQLCVAVKVRRLGH